MFKGSTLLPLIGVQENARRARHSPELRPGARRPDPGSQSPPESARTPRTPAAALLKGDAVGDHDCARGVARASCGPNETYSTIACSSAIADGRTPRLSLWDGRTTSHTPFTRRGGGVKPAFTARVVGAKVTNFDARVAARERYTFTLGTAKIDERRRLALIRSMRNVNVTSDWRRRAQTPKLTLALTQYAVKVTQL